MKIEVDDIDVTPTYRVENKPVPDKRPYTRYQLYPFAKMKVGQSFYIDAQYDQVVKVRVAACQYGKRHDMTFSVIRDGEGFRCGRVR
jgi:hypothetical protein